MFYQVTYKGFVQSAKQQKSIVKANSKAEAEKLFNNPAEKFGPRNEIRDVKAVSKVAKNWAVTFDNGKGFPMMANLVEGLDLSVAEFPASVRGKRIMVKMEQVISFNPARKEAMLKSK